MTDPIIAEAGLDIGDRAPLAGTLTGADGKRTSIAAFDDARLLAIIFVSNGCPTVRAYTERLNRIQRDYGPRGLRLVAVNSNNPYLSPPDAPAEVVKYAAERGLEFPYLKDENSGVARAVGAVCTPHVFLFDHDRRLRYRGRVDDARDPTRVTSRDLAAAIEDVLAGRSPAVEVTEPFGCAIVW
jgi:hypothetical protein